MSRPTNERWVATLRKDADHRVPDGLDRQVRACLRTMPLEAVRPFGNWTLALGISVAAILAMIASLASAFAAAGAAERGVGLGAAWVIGYLATSGVVVLPLLLRLRVRRNLTEAGA